MSSRGGSNRRTIEELNAHALSYVAPVTKTQMTRLVLGLGLGVGALMYLLTFRTWLAAVGFIIGVVVAFREVLPNYVDRIVANKAYVERNRFMNIMTQILTSPTKNFNDCLSDTMERLSQGTVLHDDLKLLLADIGDRGSLTHFLDFATKYGELEGDEAFSQYMEQLGVAFEAGLINLSTLKNLTSIHNDNQIVTDDFIRTKKAHLKDVSVIMGIACFIPVMLLMSMGYDVYIEAFAHNLLANAFSFAWLGLNGWTMIKYTRAYYDDNIMEVSL